MRKHLLLAATALLAAPAAAQQAQDDPTIVVTGRALDDTERALRACLARKCPPEEDIAATLAHAENQFVAGNYKAARGTLLASRSRNRKFARDYPIPVSDLLRANARVAGHLGEGQAQKLGLIDSLDALREGLPAGDARILIQRVEVADAFASLGRFKAADDIYKAVGRDARKHGYGRLEAAAMLRSAWLWSHATQGNVDYRSRALHALDEVIDSPDPAYRPFAQAARVMKAQLLASGGDSSAIDALIAQYVRMPPTTRPVLLYSAPIDLEPLGTDFAADAMVTTDGRMIAAGGGHTRRALARDELEWVDVVYWIRPDGTPADIEVARRSARGEKEWERHVTAAIAARRYAPLRLAADEPGLLRVERYTYTANYADMKDETGTRLRRRYVTPKIEMLDLSVDSAATRAVAGDKG